MRILVLLRGTPGCGKSTWIKQNGLEQYALSADNLRLLFRSPIMDKNGNLIFVQVAMFEFSVTIGMEPLTFLQNRL